MIQSQTRLKVADNTGARTIQCIRVMGRSLKTDAGVGDVIIASVKQAIPNAAVKKGDVVRAVVVRTAKEYGRADGSYIRFDENAAVLGRGLLEALRVAHDALDGAALAGIAADQHDDRVALADLGDLRGARGRLVGRHHSTSGASDTIFM